MSPTPSRLAHSSTGSHRCPAFSLYHLSWLLIIAVGLISLVGQAMAGTVGHIRITPVSLPAATAQSPYIATLTASGGTAPYQFSISRGTLPPGLSLDSSSGSITGTPSAAGHYAFLVKVTDSSGAARGDRAFKFTVVGSGASITVTVSPTSAAIVSGASQQFSATVSGTSQTAVNWMASAGNVSSSGLFTAPSVQATTTVQVTATSVAAPTQQASASISVTPKGSAPGLTVSTTGLPLAITGTAYQANLSAAGGQMPYQWSLVSGSLPAGISFLPTGSIAGVTTATGVFNFTVQVQDAARNTASAALSLQANSQGGGGNCGPPTYNCSRSDIVPAPNPVVPPHMGASVCGAGQLSQCGNLTGINRVVLDPDFNNRIVRVTDSTTAGGATMVTATSGSDDSNTWNHDSTMFLVQDITASAYLFAFNPSTMQATKLGQMPYLAGGSGWSWSFVNPGILYRVNGTTILSYDLTGFTGGTVPNPTTIYDFNNPQCLGADRNWLANPVVTWRSQFAISMDDQSFASGYSNAGGQGTGVFTTVYVRGKGCRLLDSKSGIVYGQWGTNGPISIPDRWTTHANVLGKSGTWDIVGYTTCLSATCGGHPYFWDVATTTVNSPSGCLSGHWTEGNTHWMNNSGCKHIGENTIRQFSAPSSVSSISQVVGFPHHMVLPFDQHFSWNNVDPNDTYPIISGSWTNITSPLPDAWYNEILATFPASVGGIPAGTVKRFAHSFISGTNQRFNTHYAIGSVSQDGRFFMFASDWMGTLGSESGGVTCTIGTDCRGDVFIVELR